MKSLIVALSMALTGAALYVAPIEAEAQRLGRGRPAGMQRQTPPPRPATPPQQPAQQPATPAATPNAAGATAGAAAAAPRRSWMGPIAGLAAGLGIAALFSHFGLGAGLANFMTMALLAIAAVFVVRWLLRRYAGNATRSNGKLQFATGGAAGAVPPVQREATPSFTPPAFNGGAAGHSPAVAATPLADADFDQAGFERIAKMLFIRMQAANDAAQVDDLRKFTTPELFSSLRVDLHERGARPQQTDVMQLDAQVVDTEKGAQQDTVSVRFHGLVRESAEAPAEPFDEVWHFVRPSGGERDWAVAGIQPVAA